MSNTAFRRNFSAILKRAGDKSEQVVRKVAIELQNSMILKSPVGNPDLWKSKPPPGYVGGRFRSNWQCGIGAANTSTSDAIGSDASGRTSTALQGWKPGQTIVLTNSLPYARVLEYGSHSSQAPQGMVRLTVNEYTKHLEKVIAELQ